MNQPTGTISPKRSNLVYLIWGIISLPFLYIVTKTLLCENFAILKTSDPMSCGSDSAGIPTVIGAITLAIWTLLSFIIFLATRKRVASYIFGVLLLAEIIYTALNVHF